MTRNAARIARLYAAVPPEQRARLERFRAAYPLREATIGGVSWPYLCGGSGDEAILLLPGALGSAESGWTHFEQLAPRYRVLAPSYPPVETMAALADGIAGMLAHEGIARAHVVGASYGGFVAQVLVRRHPARTASLVLAHTGYPDALRGERIARLLRLMLLLPMPLLRALFKRRMDGLLAGELADAALFEAHYTELIRYHLDKRQMIAGYHRVVDFDRNYHFTPLDLVGWPGRVQLIFADNDQGTPESVREQLAALYPGAKVHVFHGTGHAAPLLRQEEYLGVIEELIRDAGAVPRWRPML